MDTEEFKSLSTITQIADDLEEPPQRVAYIVSKLRLKPAHRIGIIRLFGEKDIAKIREGLYNIQVRRT